MAEAGFIKYVVIIGIILVAVFLSQRANITEWVKSSTGGITQPAQETLQKGSSWAQDTLLPKINGEVEKRGELVQEGLNEQTEKISNSTQSVGEKVKNYFSGITNSILHPGEPQNCPAAPNPLN